MDKRFKLTYLADIYGGLLTQKQQDILNMYLNEDMSFSEIAKVEDISRQAAFDLVKRSENLLLNYDEKLNLFDRYLENKRMLEEIKVLSEGNLRIQQLVDKLTENI